MRIRLIFPVFGVFMIMSMLFTACNFPGFSSEEEEGPGQLEMAITMTVQAMEIEELKTEAAKEADEPTETPEPEPEAEVDEAETVSTETIEAVAETVHDMIPGEFPAGQYSSMTDPDSSLGAEQKRALAGEDFSSNIYERPFTTETMLYQPDLDIILCVLNAAAEFTFVEIQVQGEHENGGLQGNYGVELDLDRDGRGDILILASNLQSDWSTDGVFAWKDTNNDVGGETPVNMDGSGGNGYDQLVFDEGKGDDPDLVWARVSPDNPTAAQLAFKPDLFEWKEEYLWWAVTDNMVKDPALYDYNDYFTHDEAGSPLQGLAQYPIKLLAEFDNTCRWSVGFIPNGTEPGLCSMQVDMDVDSTSLPDLPINTPSP